MAAFSRVPPWFGDRIVVAGERSLLHVDRTRQVGRHGQEPVAGDVVEPLHHLRDRAAGALHLARLLEQLDADLLGGPVGAGDAHRLRLDRDGRHAQALVLKWVLAVVDPQRDIVVHLVADARQPVAQPLAEPVLLQHRHDDVDVGLELAQPLSLVVDRAVVDPLEGNPEALLEGAGQGDEVRHVHLHLVGVAVVADHLLAESGDGPVVGRRPPPLGGPADDDHRPPVGRVPLLHGLQRCQDLVVVVAVVQGQHVPAVRRPLLGDPVAVERLRHHAADQRVVDAGVVERQQDAQPFAHLLGHRLRLHLL